ncbi:MAG: GMC oxidoreductase [Pseudobdellovibrionaceae bacterium]
MNEHYDILIIGSGAGGGALAYRLANAGLKILIIERGPFLPREKQNWDTTAVFLEERYHTKEVWQDSEGNPLHPQTGYWVGGNTKVYGAALFRLREKDFEELRHKDGLSPAWPVGYKDFEPYYTEAENLFEVHGLQGLDPTEPYRSHEYPYPAVSNEPIMQEIEDNLKKLSLHPFPTPLGLMINEKNMVESQCIRCDTCDAYPCLVHAKSDADVNCIRKVMHLPNVTLITETEVLRIVTDATGREVKFVEARVKNNSMLSIFSADLVAISCGAINSAALLLRSANDKHPRGLANSSDQVGRNFMYHQANAILAVGLKKTKANYMKTVSVNDFYFGSQNYPFPMGNIQPLGSFHFEMMRAQSPELTSVAPDVALEALAERGVPWWLMTEDLPNPENRVRLVGNQIQLNYQANNVESSHQLLDTWIHTLKKMGHAQNWIHLDAYFKKKVPLEGVGHQNGTCRFGENPKSSVLNLNCQTHDINNLYVVDASFFPSCGAVNPCLTIVANALRVGDQIVKRWKGHQ